jgi:hypothetical protein
MAYPEQRCINRALHVLPMRQGHDTLAPRDERSVHVERVENRARSCHVVDGDADERDVLRELESERSEAAALLGRRTAHDPVRREEHAGGRRWTRLRVAQSSARPWRVRSARCTRSGERCRKDVDLPIAPCPVARSGSVTSRLAPGTSSPSTASTSATSKASVLCGSSTTGVPPRGRSGRACQAVILMDSTGS